MQSKQVVTTNCYHPELYAHTVELIEEQNKKTVLEYRCVHCDKKMKIAGKLYPDNSSSQRLYAIQD